MNELFFNNLQAELLKPLPGKEAQLLMAPETRQLYKIKISRKTIKSSILIPLFVIQNEIKTVLFKRAEYEGFHAGQTCFPGGKSEKKDASLEETAIREAWEEIGIEKEKVKIIGRLTPLHIPVSDYLVFPYVGLVKEIPVFKTDPVEVNELIIISLKTFLNPQNTKNKIQKRINQSFSIPYYSINDHEVWGATAMIISELSVILQRPSFQQINWYNADTFQ